MENKTVPFIVGPVRASYAHVYKPRYNDLSERNEFSVVCLIPKSESEFCPNPGEIKAALERQIKETLPKGGKQPLKDGDAELNSSGEPKHPGYWYFTAKTGGDYPPMVIDPRRVPVGESSGWQSGDWCKVKIKVKPYEKGANKGVSIFLTALQWTSKDEPFSGGGDPLAGFEAIEGAGEEFDPFAGE